MSSADFGSLDDSASTVELGAPSPESHVSPRLTVLDDYEIEMQIGKGGMGEVYLATERGLGRQVALKVLPAANRVSHTQVKRFMLEARAAAQLSHDHIVPIYHIGQCKGIHYFTMRYIEGNDLSEIIQDVRLALDEKLHESHETQPTDSKNRSKSTKADSTVHDRGSGSGNTSRIDLSTSSFVGSQKPGGSRSAHRLAVSVALIGQAVAEALHHAHQHGIVHRDIKPSNLMLDDTNKIWVTDFGLAQLQDAPELTQTGAILGTLRYMSPEQATGRKAFVDHRTDIYSLGVTLHELATLQKACRGETAQEILRAITFERPQPIRKINPRMPRDLETIICKATERNPSDRYQSAADMAADLERFVNNQSLTTRRPSRLKAVRNWIWDRPALSASLLATVLVFAGSMAAVAMAYKDSSEKETRRADLFKTMVTFREGQQLVTKAQMLSDEQPGLAIAAGLEGAKAAPSSDADLALMLALNVNHELKCFPFELRFPGSFDVTSDGRLAALCSQSQHIEDTEDGVLVLDLNSGQRLRELDCDGVPIAARFFGADKYLLTVSRKPQAGNAQPVANLTVWDTANYRKIRTSTAHGLVRLADSLTNTAHQQIAIPNAENSITVLEAPGFEEVMRLPQKHTEAVIVCSFSPDRSLLATWSLDSTAIVWNVKTGEVIRQIPHACRQPEQATISFTADSNRLCISERNGSRFVDLKNADQAEWRRPEMLVATSSKSDLAFLVDGVRKTVVTLNTKTGEVMSVCKSDVFMSSVTPLWNDQLIATTQDQNIVVYSIQNGQQVAVLKGHTDYIQAVTPFAGKKELFSVGLDRKLRHWHIESDLARRTLAAKIDASRKLQLALSPEGDRALVGTIRVGQAYLKNLGTNEPTSLKLRGDLVAVLSGNRALTSSTNEVSLWDMRTQKRIRSIEVMSSQAIALKTAFEIPGTNCVALVTPENGLYIWDVDSAFAIPYRNKDGDHLTSVTVDRTPCNLLIGTPSGDVFSVDIKSGNRQPVCKFPSAPVDLQTDVPGRWLLATTTDGKAMVKELDSDKAAVVITKPGVYITHAVFAGQEQLITHGGFEGKEVTRWSLKGGQEVESLPLTGLMMAEVNAANNLVALATTSGVTLWNLESNEKKVITPRSCTRLAFLGEHLLMATEPASSSPDSSSENGFRDLLLFNCESGATETTRWNNPPISRILPLQDSSGCVLVANSYGVDCVDLDSGKSLREFGGHRTPLLFASYGPTSDDIVTVSSDGKILLHTLSSGASTELGAHEHPITATAVSADRKLLLTAETAVGIRHWDLENRKLVRDMPVDGKPVTKLAFSPTNTSAAAQVGDKEIKHWDLRRDTEKTFTLKDALQKFAFSSDGKSLLVLTGTRPVYPGHILETTQAIANRKPPQVVLIDVATANQAEISVEGFASDCEFVDHSRSIAILSTHGRIHLFDSTTRKLMRTFSAPRHTTQLLSGADGSPCVFAASRMRVSEWKAAQAQKVHEFPLELSASQAALLPDQIMDPGASAFYLLLSNEHIIKQPVDIQAYAEKVAPCQLTDGERHELLQTID